MKRLLKPSDLSKQPSRKQATVMQAVGGYVNTGIVMVQGLLLIPLYIHYIGAHTYGLWLASGGILGMMTLMNFGVGSMLIQRISRAYGQKDLEQAGAYFFNGMIVYLFICLLFGLVGWGISFWVPSILKMTGNEVELLRSCFQLAVVAMTIGILNECLRSFGQAMLRPVIPMIGMAVGRILGITVTVWMLFDGFGLWAIPTGLLVAEGVAFVVNLLNTVLLFRDSKAMLSIDFRIIKEYLQTAPVLLLARLGQHAPQEAEPLLIAILLTPEVTAAYMITRRAADIVFMLLSQIVGSSMGSFSHLVGEGNDDRTKEILSLLFNLVFWLGLIGFTMYLELNGAFVSLWVGEGLLLDQYTIALISIAFLARITRSMLWQLLNSKNDFTFTSVTIFFEGLVRIALVVMMVGMLGVVGVPFALFIVCLISLLIFSMRVNKLFLLQVKVSSLGKFFSSLVILYGIAILFVKFVPPSESWYMFTFSSIGLLLGSALICTLMNFKVCIKFLSGSLMEKNEGIVK